MDISNEKNESHDQVELQRLVAEKIKHGEDLLNSCDSLKKIEGMGKLQRKLNQELKFLKKVSKQGCVKKEHLQCSNLTHWGALLQVLSNCAEKVTSIARVHQTEEGRKVTVDLVRDGGLTWVKVVARNPRSLAQVCAGQASYGQRSVLDQAGDYLKAARLNPCLFQTPKVVFVFVNGVGSRLASRLENKGVAVQGERLDFEEQDEFSNSSSDEENSEETPLEAEINELSSEDIRYINRVNMDVSAMLAYCSSVTNGGALRYHYQSRVLAEQAQSELAKPQKPILERFIAGKQLYCCQTAMDGFQEIVATVGGPEEQNRARELVARITVLPDDAVLDGSEEDCEVFGQEHQYQVGLTVGGRIRERSLTVFTFGDRIRAVTVTANDGFVRAAKQQGINFVVFVHESRALTEQKEMTRATPREPAAEASKS